MRIARGYEKFEFAGADYGVVFVMGRGRRFGCRAWACRGIASLGRGGIPCRFGLPPCGVEGRGQGGAPHQGEVGRRGVRPQGDGAVEPHGDAGGHLRVHPLGVLGF